MPKPLPPRLQVPADQIPAKHALPLPLREVYAEALKAAELEYRTAQASGDPARYARALAEYDRLQAAFPFVAAGSGDVEA